MVGSGDECNVVGLPPVRRSATIVVLLATQSRTLQRHAGSTRMVECRVWGAVEGAERGSSANTHDSERPTTPTRSQRRRTIADASDALKLFARGLACLSLGWLYDHTGVDLFVVS